MLVEPPSILITDDDRAVRETLHGVFQQRGFHALTAYDGREALRIVETETVHLVLMDLNMPRLTGIEAIRLAKQCRSPLPCILITAAADEAVREQARQADAFMVLSKPLTFAAVTGAVSDAMRQFYDWPPMN